MFLVWIQLQDESWGPAPDRVEKRAANQTPWPTCCHFDTRAQRLLRLATVMGQQLQGGQGAMATQHQLSQPYDVAHLSALGHEILGDLLHLPLSMIRYWVVWERANFLQTRNWFCVFLFSQNYHRKHLTESKNSIYPLRPEQRQKCAETSPKDLYVKQHLSEIERDRLFMV